MKFLILLMGLVLVSGCIEIGNLSCKIEGEFCRGIKQFDYNEEFELGVPINEEVDCELKAIDINKGCDNIVITCESSDKPYECICKRVA